MESGAHVLSEKPIGLNSAECEHILAAVKETGKRYMVAQVVRFMAQYVYLRNAIECGKYGKLESLTLQRFSQTPMCSWENWMLDAQKSGQVAIDLMIHDVDFMQYVLGEPKQISGAYRELDDSLTNYGFANYIYYGFAVLVESGWYKDQKTRFQATFKAVFENGNIILDNGGKLYDCNEAVDFSSVEKLEKTQINISNVDGYAAEIQYFIDCISTGKPNDLALGESSAASTPLLSARLILS
jgi:predicted dehydrogenase